MKDPLASVVIPVGPDAELLGQCLDRVARQDFSKKEVIVVCDPRAGDLASLPAGSEDVKVMRERHPAGVARLINSGMRAARGHVKILLMPHCIPVGTGWIRSMVEPFENDEVGVVVSQCLAHDRNGPGLPSRLLDTVDPPQRRNVGAGPAPQQVVGHLCDAYRASLLADVGYFQDDGLSEPGQAADISIKVADAGYTILLSDSAVATYNVPQNRRRLGAALKKALDYGSSDAVLDKLYDLHWLNAGVFAVALLSLVLLPVALVNLPVAWIVGFGIFIWAWFLAVRMPLLHWECPVAVLNAASYILIVLLIRADWWPAVFGKSVHPAILRQWSWLAAVTGSCLLLVVGAAFRSALRVCRQPGGLLYALPVFVLGVLWWLLAGAGYLRGRLLAPSRKD